MNLVIWLLAIGIGAIFLSHTAPFPFLLERFAPAHALWRMPADEPKTVYLTFDDGPNPQATPALLDVLAREKAHATFFLIDDYLTQETAPIVQRMFEDGHAVALHSNTRALMLQTPEELEETLEGQAERIEDLTGYEPCRLFRPHAGWRSGSMYAGVARAGYRLVGWSWGLWDWNWYRRKDARRLAAKLARDTDPGEIVVMHDGHHVEPRADRQYAVEATALLVPALKKRGFRLGTLCGDPPGQFAAR